jgi:hypothetical protein
VLREEPGIEVEGVSRFRSNDDAHGLALVKGGLSFSRRNPEQNATESGKILYHKNFPFYVTF